MTTLAADAQLVDGSIRLARNLVRKDDWLLVEEGDNYEVMEVKAINPSQSEASVARGRLGTRPVQFFSGASVKRFQTKWIVMSKRPPIFNDPVHRIACLQTPPFYKPVGIVTSPGHPSYAGSSAEQRLQSGYATYRNGRVDFQDPDSYISFVGS